MREGRFHMGEGRGKGQEKRCVVKREQAQRSSAYIKTNKEEEGLAGLRPSTSGMDGVRVSGLGSEGGWRGLQASRVLVNSKVGSERRR